MNLSRVSLEKEGRTVILQGMRHIAPAEFYKQVQNEIDELACAGYAILFEKLIDDPTVLVLTRNGKQIEKFFRNFSSAHKHIAKKEGSIAQKIIVYPQEAIHADMVFQDYVNLLDKNGIRFTAGLYLFSFVSWYMKKERKLLASRIGKVLLFLFALSMRIPSKIALRAWQKSYRAFAVAEKPFRIEYRNKIAVSKIIEVSRERNVFLPYGNSHIPGISELLQADGWSFKEN